MANTSWAAAEPARKAAEWLIGQFHRHLEDNHVRIVCLFRSDLPESMGREVWGGVAKVGGMQAFLAAQDLPGVGDALELNDLEWQDGTPVVVLWFSEPVWKRLESARERLALVDELLCRVHSETKRSGGVVISKRRPDAEVFFGNLGRFGAWHGAIDKAVEAIRAGGQIALPLEIGSLDALVSERQAEEALGEVPTAEVLGMGSLDEADLAPGVRGVPLDEALGTNGAGPKRKRKPRLIADPPPGIEPRVSPEEAEARRLRAESVVPTPGLREAIDAKRCASAAVPTGDQ